MCTQMAAVHPPPGIQLEAHANCFPPCYSYYPPPATTAISIESFPFLSDQSYDTYQQPYCNSILPLQQIQIQHPKNPIPPYTSSPGYPANLLADPNPSVNRPTSQGWPAHSQPTICTNIIDAGSLPARSSLPEKDVKRQRYLEKNRAAATKCRSKKKQYIQQLQSRYEDLSLTRDELQMQVRNLRLGLVSLKEELVLHARCGDAPITNYIEKRRMRCA